MNLRQRIIYCHAIFDNTLKRLFLSILLRRLYSCSRVLKVLHVYFDTEMYRDVQLLECSVVKIEFLSKFLEYLSNNLSTSPTYLHFC